MKKRRGRQPRQSLVNSSLRQAVQNFTSHVGAPIIQPGGFRDFTGWLESIKSPRFQSSWIPLCQAFIVESSSFPEHQRHALKRDVVQEIIKLVVKRKPEESAKLVSTNARRQCNTPPSGNTVMTIFESYLVQITSSNNAGTSLSMTQGGNKSPDSLSRKRGRSSFSDPTSSSLSPRHRHSTMYFSGGASGMRISSLLSHESPRNRPSNQGSKLPSLTQFDEQIRARSEKERHNSL